MESYDVFLMGNFLALPAFTSEYGVFDAAKNEYTVVAKWQSALQVGGLALLCIGSSTHIVTYHQVSGQLGALIGVFIAGPLTNRFGYRWATIIGLMALNGFIFIFYFAGKS